MSRLNKELQEAIIRGRQQAFLETTQTFGNHFGRQQLNEQGPAGVILLIARIAQMTGRSIGTIWKIFKKVAGGTLSVHEFNTGIADIFNINGAFPDQAWYGFWWDNYAEDNFAEGHTMMTNDEMAGRLEEMYGLPKGSMEGQVETQELNETLDLVWEAANAAGLISSSTYLAGWAGLGAGAILWPWLIVFATWIIVQQTINHGGLSPYPQPAPSEFMDRYEKPGGAGHPMKPKPAPGGHSDGVGSPYITYNTGGGGARAYH